MFLFRFIRKIIKVIQWIPILWNDEDYDYSYLLEIIKYKLKRIKACLWNNAYIEHKALRDTIVDINKCISAIEEYHNADEVFEEYFEKQPINISYINRDKDNGYSEFVSINLDTNKQLTDKENHIYCEWIRRKNDFEQKKWNEIWNRLKEYGQSFWD